ncbi:SET domain-containing protein [Calocera cornea HHB12733]|uniref:SET domain-containing protein n=1 Tax=Calocera cornea HHB12733 TaxID=1353952 RepID=A0A165CXP6_9BASI|nr:SET domain-containing protein [Calocera cornea HHB12733]
MSKKKSSNEKPKVQHWTAAEEEEMINILNEQAVNGNWSNNSFKNTRSQDGLDYDLELYWHSTFGYGVRALEAIPAGEFLATYTGSTLSERQAAKLEAHDPVRATYFFGLSTTLAPAGGRLRAKHLGQGKWLIDASQKGNLSRFINHACDDANVVFCFIQNGGPRADFPTVGLFTSRAVSAGESLAANYGDTVREGGAGRHARVLIKCRCRPDCKHVLWHID